MKKATPVTRILWTFLLLSLVLYSQKSVNFIPLFPKVNPTSVLPKEDVGITDSLHMAQQLFQNQEYKKSLQTSLRLLEKAQKQNDSVLINQTSNLIADIFNKTNNYEKAIHYYKLASSNSQNNAKEKARLNLKIGSKYYQLQQIDSAIHYFEKLIKGGSNQNTIQEYKAKAYTNLSGIYLEKVNFVKAEYYAMQSIKIHEQQKNYYSAAVALNNLGSTYLQKGEYQNAKNTLLKAIANLNKLPDSYEKSNTKEAVYDNLSEVLYYLKDYKAYSYQLESYTIRDSLRNIELSGILSEIEGKYNAENIKKQEQIKVAEEQSKRKHAQDVNVILALILISVGVGVWFWYRYHKLRQEKFRLEVKQSQLMQQNELERIQNETRDKILNAAIDGKESERKMIAETLHHSVSSLLSSANLHLQAIKMQMKGTVQPLEMEKAQKIINEASEKIRNLSHSLVSSVLLKFGLSYSIQDLCDKYTNQTLSFHFKSEGIRRYDQDFELKINSIIDELLNNIIKHSKATQAHITMISQNHHIEIQVQDNGKGFDTTIKQEKAGLGLSQIEARIKKLKGEFSLSSQMGTGTQITIKVPIQTTPEDSIEL